MKKNKFLDPMLLILLTIGFIWAKSSYGKITGGKFVQTLSQTLGKFASANPYPFFKQFLEQVAIPNSQIFGLLTIWGELFSALAIVTGTVLLVLGKKSKLTKLLLVLGLISAAFLNAIFWFASGWTSSSTDSLNLLMFLIETALILWVIKS